MIVCPLCGSSAPLRRLSTLSACYFECPECRVLTLDPSLRLSREDEKSRYLHHENSPSDPGYTAHLRKALDPLLVLLAPGMRGLDFGCGPVPTVSVLLGELGFHVENYDPLFRPDEALLNDSYDFITCTEVVEHFFNPSNEYQRLDRALKPGGVLVVMTKVYDGTFAFEGWDYLRDPTHVSLYQPQTFEWIAQAHGWELSVPSPTVRILRKSA